MNISLIVAMDMKRGIGKDNDLLWNLPLDMHYFKETTIHQIVVMGRKNYLSIPEKFRPLPKRENVVLTRNKDFVAEDCKVFHSFEEFLNFYEKEDRQEIFIIGGGEIYRQALELEVVSTMYITHVNKIYDADTFFPLFNLCDWKVETLFHKEKDAKHEAAFSIVKYTKK